MGVLRDPAGDDALAQRCAGAIVDAFAYYNREFRAVSRRAPERFENRDWLPIAERDIDTTSVRYKAPRTRKPVSPEQRAILVERMRQAREAKLQQAA